MYEATLKVVLNLSTDAKSYYRWASTKELPGPSVNTFRDGKNVEEEMPFSQTLHTALGIFLRLCDLR